MRIPEPKIDEGTGVPWCSREECMCYDGKRCELTGHRPDSICEPEVINLLKKIDILSRWPE